MARCISVHLLSIAIIIVSWFAETAAFLRQSFQQHRSRHSTSARQLQEVINGTFSTPPLEFCEVECLRISDEAGYGTCTCEEQPDGSVIQFYETGFYFCPTPTDVCYRFNCTETVVETDGVVEWGGDYLDQECVVVADGNEFCFELAPEQCTVVVNGVECNNCTHRPLTMNCTNIVEGAFMTFSGVESERSGFVGIFESFGNFLAQDYEQFPVCPGDPNFPSIEMSSGNGLATPDDPPEINTNETNSGSVRPALACIVIGLIGAMATLAGLSSEF